MKTQIFKALLATLLLACGLSKASAAIDPAAKAISGNDSGQQAPSMPCATSSSCFYR